MLIYGDAKRFERADAIGAAIASELQALARQPPGVDRHAALVRILIRVGELVQGLCDAEFDSVGADDFSAAQDCGGRLLLDLAQLVAHSWRQGFRGPLLVPSHVPTLLRSLKSPLPLCVKEAEGYAFYALYPESYIEAAACSGLAADTVVIGIRSIGTSLSAAVAAAIGARAPVSVRPIGHPFQRRIGVGPGLTERILADRTANFAIVDEGPGLSGSSFGGVADWLEEHGVSEKRIHFFPGHGGALGPQASDRHRKRWEARPRHFVDLDDLVLRPSLPAHRLESWIRELVGPLVRPLEDLSGGAWRRMLPVEESGWPPADRRFERRKFLAHTADGPWLVKFAGLGETGPRKLAKARLLAEADLAPPVVGLCHGFLVQKWISAGRIEGAKFDRAKLIGHVGRYLAFRARHLPAAVKGASLSELCAMAVFNTEAVLGAEAASRLKERISDAGHFDAVVMPVDTDNRLHRWEWLVDGHGILMKTDSIDHSAAHDLVGCQDIAWDIAGASIEFELSAEERSDLRAAVSEGCARAVSRELQAILEICYLAFQLGLWTSAKAASDEEEVPRLEATATRYAQSLMRIIDGQAE
ncbi:hypothetical protein PYH37_002287 [Sinorhizobium numidicum]|uniref:Cell division protein FtsK n=1 Tax=Sinorhizobium numidicum TaxID=680248 RepID=A0ABY8D1Y6_9HYPH|nr:hypothetical protein [Sinorhizobium numidicum]WEX77487.1 hypothetical protein PYH37_002287 [Sinorhizobium numidicum]WEX84147.1 hypothetical protein PYH38_003000 [Sinorhizobium numidicum]